MDNFKGALIHFAHSNPSLFPDDAATSYPMLIQDCFRQFFPDFQTPDHPPYAAMIYRAIRELNKKGGSSEKSISKFIKKEYPDLPWAHSTLLKHHLEKLCDSKEICMTHKQRYLLASEESEPVKENSEPSKKRKKQKTQSNSQPGKKSSRPHKKYKKVEKCGLDVQEVSEKEQTGMHKRKRKRKLKSVKKSSKRVKKQAMNEPLEVKIGDIQNQEQSEQIQTEKSPEPLQPEGSPDPNPILQKNGKRVCTRSQSKTVLNKDTPDAVEHLSIGNQDKINEEITKVNSAVESEPQQISRSTSLEKSLIELISSTEVQDPKDQQPEKSPVEVKPKCKRRGRPPKAKRSQKLAKKGKVGNKKVQPKHKHDGGIKKTRRSSRKTSC